MIQMYVKTKNNNVVILNGVRDSFRCRQRKKETIDKFRFVSYKKILKERKKINNRVHGPYPFETVARL